MIMGAGLPKMMGMRMGAHCLPAKSLNERRRHKKAEQGANMEAAEHVGGGARALTGVDQPCQHVC